MRTHDLSPSIYRYVMGIYKGSGETLGNIATQARQFEIEMNAYFDELDLLEGLRG